MSLRYVQSDGDTFVRHIHDVEPTRWDDDNYCFARKLSPEKAARFGVSKLQIVTPPYFDPATQCRDEGDALLVDGVWTQNYIVTDLDISEATVVADAQWDMVRSERNRLLAGTDWWVTKSAEIGRVISVAQHEYRQALRDVTKQADPFNIIWPIEPEV